MASGSQLMTTYYAKRIIGDSAASSPDKALLQTGGNLTNNMWILNQTSHGNSIPYGIKYEYNSSTGDVIAFVGGVTNDSGTKASINLKTGDATILGILTIINSDESGNLSATEYSGNAATATKLAIAREIYVDLSSTRNTNSKVTFDGSVETTAIHVSGTLAVARGGTGKTTALEAITNLGGAYINATGTEITANSNLDSGYKTIGTYYSLSSSRSSTLTGTVPITDSGFKMITYGGYRTETLRQFLGGANNDLLYRSTQDTGTTWTKWYKFVLLPSGSDKKTFDAIGGNTTPVYVNSSGIITAGTTLGGAAYKAENYYALASHTHGNITNDGCITTAITLAADDYIIVGDNSASGKLGKGPAFDGSTTTKCLTQKGTWASFTNNAGTITGITMNGVSKGTSGVVDLGTVITAHQDISGKADLSGATFTGYVYLKNNDDAPRLYFGSKDSTGASAGFIYYSMGQTNNIYRPSKFNIRVFSYNSSTGTTDTSHYETYSLPQVTADMTNTKTYNILTDKDLSFSITGNATTATKATQDGSGNTITTYYCTLSTDQTITGTKSWGTSGAGGQLNGAATNGGINSIRIGDDVWLGDCNSVGIMGMKSTSTNCGFYMYNSSGTQIGQLYFNGTNLYCNKTIEHPDAAVSYIAGAKGSGAALYAKKTYNENHWYPAVALETKVGGSWQMGNYNDETLEFCYATKANRDSDTNTVTEIYMNAGDTGRVATSGNVGTGDSNGQVKIAGTNVSVKGLKSAAYTESTAYATSGHNHDSTYLKLSGGTITGWLYIKNDDDAPRISFGSNDSTGASGGFIYMAMTQTNSIYRPTRYCFRIFSYNSSTGATDSSHYETYYLPQVTAGMTNTKTYNILTDKDLSFSITGNAATATTLQNARTLTIGSTGKSFNGSGNVSWTLAEIGAAAATHSHAYLPTAGGAMTGAIQFNGRGSCSIYNGPNDAGNSYNGALNNLVISSWYGVSFTTSCANQTCTDKNAFSINCRNGYAYAGRMYNAVWNDYAEFRKGDTIEPGRCMIETSSGVMTLSNKRLQPGAKIISDTYGYSMGETEETKTPIAVSGRVLVYPYQARENYKLGAAVCSAPNGTVDIMTREEIMKYPERIVGTVSEIPTYEVWSGGAQSGNDDIQVNGRIWIYVR